MIDPAALATSLIMKACKNLSEEDSKIIEKVLVDFLEDARIHNDELLDRIQWLENAVDDRNLEEIMVGYQQKFKGICWSGDAS